MPEIGAIHFAGYDLPEVLHEEGEVLLLRCIRHEDGVPVLAWLLPEGAPARHLVERLQREQAILHHLAAQGERRASPRPLGLERDGASVALMLEDPGGVPLEQLLGTQALPVEMAIDLALAIVTALARVHAAGVLHRDLRPAHILIDLARGEAALVGFAAAVIADEAPAVELPPAAAPYISPEMTGRTGRDCDQRSDYYALGAVLYRMLTGRPPFDEADPLRLIHAHIVRLPMPPDALRPAVPRGLARVVIKLLAKTPEARYQSAHGLRADLLRCRDAWQRGEALDFEPGQQDRSERLLVPDALLGRLEHVSSLLTIFEGCAGGSAGLALLLGPSGIGKSAILRELQAPIAKRGGRIATGACRRLDQATPYAALAHGVQGLFRQALAESGAPLQAWRELLQAALAGEGRLLQGVLPELELVLGPQPPVPALPPVERANRFRRVFRQLLQALARPQHPLVVVLEDLQWCDQATLDLLADTLSAGDTHHLLVLATVRGELPEAGPLTATLASLAARGLAIHRESIRPLQRDEVAAWLAATLRPCQQDLTSLIDLVHASTAGNPFLMRLLVESLHEQHALRFDGEQGAWEWRPQQAALARLPDDLGALVTERLRELSPAAREALMTAACIGPRFEMRLLATLLAAPLSEVTAAVREAETRGLVLAVDGAWQFLHERVQQAASAALPPARAQALHLAIGRALASGTSGEFEVVHHLNLGAALLTDPAERRELAAHNLRAAHGALAATAFAGAASYAQAGVTALGAGAWDREPALCFALTRAEMEARYMLGDLDGGREHYAPLLARAVDEHERAALCELKVGLDIFHGRLDDAITSGIEGLARLDVAIVARPEAEAVAQQYQELEQLLAGREPAELAATLPLAEDRLAAAAMRILMAIGPAAMFVHGRLAFTIFIAIVRLSLIHGITRATGYGLAGLGTYLAGARGQVERAHAFGQLALRLNERAGDDALTAKIHQLVGVLIVGWVRPFAAGSELLQQGYRLGLRTGDLIAACYNASSLVLVHLARNASVGEVRDTVETLLRESGRVLEVHGSEVFHMAGRWARVLSGELPAPTPETAQAWIRDVFDPGFERPNGLLALYHGICRMQLLYLFGCHEAILPLPPQATERLKALATPVAVDAFYLPALAACARASPALDEVPAVLERLARWATNCPANFAARHALLAAEYARARGQDDEAASRYKDAIRAARRHGEAGTEALACELAGKHAAGLGDDVLSDMYFQTSVQTYTRWGATAKAQQLARGHGLRTRPRSSAPEPVATFDLSSLIRAARALSGEIRLERLLRILLEVAMENAGARRGVVVLAFGDGWRVEAEGDADPLDIRVDLAVPIEQHAGLPLSIVRYVARSQQYVLLARADHEGEFRADPFIASRHVQSVVCLPVLHQGRCTGVLYLEHALSGGVFTLARLELLRQLAAQLAISVENARLVADLQRARNQAVAAERVKGRFLMNMSHELRTPLNAVIGYSELMQESLELGHHDALGSDLARIRRAAYNLLRTLSGLLELSKLASGASSLESANVDVAALVREVAADCQALANGRGNALELAVPTDIGSIYSDRAMLRYCLHGLVENACKFTRGGRITIKVERSHFDDRAHLLFSVSDTGIGIPAAYLESIFNAFTQVDDAATRAYEGTGVGLTVTRQFGRMMGGEVSVASEVGRGSTFTLRVPVSFTA